MNHFPLLWTVDIKIEKQLYVVWAFADLNSVRSHVMVHVKNSTVVCHPMFI